MTTFPYGCGCHAGVFGESSVLPQRSVPVRMSRDAFKIAVKPRGITRKPRVPARLRHIGRTADTPADHPCGSLCSHCGYLRNPVIEAGYRVAAGDEPRGCCPSCGEEAWLDLRRDDVMLALSENESFALDRSVKSWALESASVLVLGSVGLFLGVMLAQLFLGTGALMPAGLTTIATVLAAVAIVRRMYELGRPPRPRALPMRWRWALPSPEPVRLEDAPVVLGGDPLIAPLSGRPCLAYDVAVRADHDGRAPLGTWHLIEQQTAELRSHSRTVAPGKAWLELSDRRVFDPDTAADGQRVERFLRERGFTPHDHRVFETIVQAEATVRATTEGGRVVIRPGIVDALPPARD